MKLNIREMSNASVLSGAVNGKRLFGSMIAEASPEPEEPTPLFLDFSGIDIATASFLRESAVALKAYMRATSSKFYPVLANLAAETREEVAVLMDARNDAILVCSIDEDETVKDVEMIGQLDPKQEMTFRLVQKMTTADAGSLMQEFGEAEKTKSTTAWNNRLNGLVQRGLVREYSKGRSKFYRPLIEEVG